MARSTILTISIVVLLFFVSNFVVNGIPGGRTKVGDVKTNKEVQELGRYSVEEHNRLERSNKGGAGDLKFSKVLEAETQVVSGIKYYLEIETIAKSGVSKVFHAEVVVKPWMHSKQLLTFKPSPVSKGVFGSAVERCLLTYCVLPPEKRSLECLDEGKKKRAYGFLPPEKRSF